MHCPKCHHTSHVKNGIVQGKQRYKCKGCGCNYRQSSLSRTSVDVRKEAIKLYLEGVGFRGIERLTGISNVTVMRWVRTLGEKIQEEKPVSKQKVAIMELDELWHFIGKKTKMLGVGGV
jgi:transposase-like protein